AAAILTEDAITLENMPQVRDIETERKLLASMGAEVELREGEAQDRTTISCRKLSDPVAKYEIVKTMRASSLVLVRWWPAAAWRASPCRAAVRLAEDPSTCTSKASRRWARSSRRSMVISMRASIRRSAGCTVRIWSSTRSP